MTVVPLVDSSGFCEWALLSGPPECSGKPVGEVSVWIGPRTDDEMTVRLCDSCQRRFDRSVAPYRAAQRSA